MEAPSVPPPIEEDDSALANSEVLTRQEVLKRRARRLRQLAKCYRQVYWLLMEELRRRIRDYYWKYGSPFMADEGEERENRGLAESVKNNHNGNCNEGNACENARDGSKLRLGLGFNVCAFPECTSKAMALSRYCHIHILSDPKQNLYKACKYTLKIAPTGSIICNGPILKSAYPSLCPMHAQKLEKNMIKELRKGGVAGNASTKLASKFHVVVTQYVRQIQNKRRAALRRNTSNLP